MRYSTIYVQEKKSVYVAPRESNQLNIALRPLTTILYSVYIMCICSSSSVKGTMLRDCLPRFFMILTHLYPLFLFERFFEYGFHFSEIFACEKLRGVIDTAQSDSLFRIFCNVLSFWLLHMRISKRNQNNSHICRIRDPNLLTLSL